MATDFAISYVRDRNGIENPAYDRQNGYAAWSQSQRPVPGGGRMVVRSASIPVHLAAMP